MGPYKNICQSWRSERSSQWATEPWCCPSQTATSLRSGIVLCVLYVRAGGSLTSPPLPQLPLLPRPCLLLYPVFSSTFYSFYIPPLTPCFRSGALWWYHMTRGGHALSRGPPNRRGTQMFLCLFSFSGTSMVIRLLNVASREICAAEEVARCCWLFSKFYFKFFFPTLCIF